MSELLDGPGFVRLRAIVAELKAERDERTPAEQVLDGWRQRLQRLEALNGRDGTGRPTLTLIKGGNRG